MEDNSRSKQDSNKTTPSNHRDFFAKLYGSLEEEYNRKREFEAKTLSHKTPDAHSETMKNENQEDLEKHGPISYIDATDEDSEDEKDSRDENKLCNVSLSSEISVGSSPTKDEEISPPRIPPPTLRQLQKRLEVSLKYYVI